MNYESALQTWKPCDSVRCVEAEKQAMIHKFQVHEGDTGSPEVQIAVISQRINQLSDHFKKYAKDHQSRRGLLKLVGQRKRLLSYLKTEHFARYEKLTKELGLRK